MKLSTKSSVLKILGFAVLFAGLFLLLLGLGMYTDRDQGSSGSGLSISIFSLALLIPGTILIFLGRKAGKENERLQSIAEIIKSHRRITITDIEEKLNLLAADVSRLLTKALSMKLIRGNFDRTTGEFFTFESEDKKLKFKFCPSCGAPLERVYLQGETVKCERCGVII